jgi:GTP-binding protein
MEGVSSLPTVVIVGRPNVGKSTLFNAIIGQRRSIVGDEPGITRDRIIGQATYNNRPFELIDTGGIITNDEELIPTQILKQARVALEDAAQIIFLIDGRAEITGADRDLAKMLRKLGKPVSMAVNKIDHAKREGLLHEFHSLGFQHLFPVSAEHRIGLDDLLDHVTHAFPNKVITKNEAGEETEEAQQAYIKVAIIGRPNVGKSTLLNALTGMERSIVSPVAGTTRDAVDETIRYEGIDYTFVDTAGIRRKGKTKLMAEKMSVVMARRHLKMSNVALLVLDAGEGVLALDATIAGYAHEEGRALILCVNKWDITPDKNKKKFMEQIRDELKFLEYAPVLFMSAHKQAGTRPLFPLIKKVYDAASVRIGTGQLNRFVETLRWEYDAKIHYMTQASVRPPTFVVFTNTNHLHFSAERFLVNRLREKFGFEGTPVVLSVKRR